jgi:hypothetical protein
MHDISQKQSPLLRNAVYKNLIIYLYNQLVISYLKQRYAVFYVIDK